VVLGDERDLGPREAVVEVCRGVRLVSEHALSFSEKERYDAQYFIV